MKKSGTRKNALVSSLAVGLAAALVIGGGSFAYLQQTSGEVTNKFDPNKVTVGLEETTGGDYNIIPGTSEEKDPEVTVNTSVDAYVYVTVEDTTEGLVTWAIADGWKKLFDKDDKQIYYREVEKSEEAQKFSVLKDDKVSYSAAITNDDMEDKNKENLNLTFQAIAIQKDGFKDPVSAYYGNGIEVTDAGDIAKAVQAAKDDESSVVVINLPKGKEITVNNLSILEGGETIYNLNGGTLKTTTKGTMYVEDGESLTIENGTLSMDAANSYYASMNIGTGASVTIKNATVNSTGSAFFPQGDTASVTIEDSTVTAGCYAVATNAGSTENYDVVITIKDSKLNVTNTDWDNCAVLLNVPGTLNIDNCEITGDRQGVIVRAGTAAISNSTITTTGKFLPVDKYHTENWGSGNEVPAAALVVGNRNGNYNANAVCTLTNTKLSADSEKAAVVYIDANNIYSANLTAIGCGLTKDNIKRGASDNVSVTLQ